MLVSRRYRRVGIGQRDIAVVLISSQCSVGIMVLVGVVRATLSFQVLDEGEHLVPKFRATVESVGGLQV